MTEESTTNNPDETEEKAENSVAPAIEFPGTRLKQEREKNHLGREEVAQHLHLDVKLIIALEEDDYDKLPSPSYICGYLRSYARLLKLPEEEIVTAYSQGKEISSALLPENVDIVPKKQSSSSSLLPLIILVIIMLGLFAMIWQLDLIGKQEVDVSRTVKDITQSTNADSTDINLEDNKMDKQDESTAETLSSSFLSTEPSEITEFKKNNVIADEHPEVATSEKETVAKQSNLKLLFNGDSWTEITDGTGKRLIYKLVVDGSVLELEGEPPFVILLGNAPVVQVFFQGEEFDHTRFHRDNIAYFRVSPSL